MRQETTNNNQNDVKVTNQITFNFNFGDSLNIVALIAGIYILRRLFRKSNIR